MPESKARLWDRFPDETEEQFDLFEIYLRERSVTETARLFFNKNGAQTEAALIAGRTYVQRLKKERKWNARVIAYDRWAAQTRDNATSEMIKHEVSLLGKKRMSIVNDLFKRYHRAAKALDRANEVETELLKESKDVDKIVTSAHLGSLNMLTTVGKAVIAEMDKLEKTHPMQEPTDTGSAQQMADAQAELMLMIAQREQAERTQAKKDGELLQ